MAEVFPGAISGSGAQDPFNGGFVLFQEHIIDLCALEHLDQALALVQSQLASVPARTPVVLIWLPARAFAGTMAADP
jgi:hypothetical protein